MSSSMDQKPILGYWDIRGFGQPIRFLLKYLNVDYVEVTYKCRKEIGLTEWDQIKDSIGLDFPNLPYWIDDKVKISESRVIIKYLCNRYCPSLLPNGQAEEIEMGLLDGVITDIWLSLVGATYYRGEDTVAVYNRNAPMKLKQVEHFLEKHGAGPWSFGSRISYVDFLLYEILYHNLAYEPNLLENLPLLKNLMMNFEKIPSISKFIASSECIKSPCFRPWNKCSI